jgi:hypothetical protein
MFTKPNHILNCARGAERFSGPARTAGQCLNFWKRWRDQQVPIHEQRRILLKLIQTPALITLLFISTSFLPVVSAQTRGSSPSSPVPIGQSLDTIIECGEGYRSHELYDARITLVEILRGEKAWERIEAADRSNPPAVDGFEYVLVRIRYAYNARGLPGTCIHSLSPEYFTAYSANGEAYTRAPVIPPQPELRKQMKAGDIFEGWLAFMVKQQDEAPLLYYSIDEGGGTQHGGGKWFVLR